MTEPFIPITFGPKFHWFGYYDKFQFNHNDTLALSMEVDFEHRTPSAHDEITLGIIDLENDFSWSPFGQSKSWGWQQGCMLQWIPHDESRLIFNDREKDKFVSRIYDTADGSTETIDFPIYTLSPDGNYALSTDFRRINDMRPGYGYAGVADPNVDSLAPDDAGIWRIDINTGKTELILSIKQLADLPLPDKDFSKAKHYFNHLLISPTGKRFVFLHRWREGDAGFQTRMMVANTDGSDLRVVEDSGIVSHFYWRDDDHMLMFSKPHDDRRSFFLYDVRDRTLERIIDCEADGHCVYLPGNEWIINDCYPWEENRVQGLYLYHVDQNRRVDVYDFISPPEYTGEYRCDLHARISRCGTKAIVDSAHAGEGRQQYLIDLEAFLKK